MAINKEQVKQLLGSGLSAEIVASSVGCDASYISQLLGDEVFAADVVALRSKALMANSERDTTIGEIETKLLNRLNDMVDEKAFYKPRDLLHAAALVNKMVRRGVQAPTNVHVQQTVVRLQIPSVISSEFKTTRNGEVIEADGQTLVTMPARTLLSKLSSRSQGEGDGEDRYDKAGKYIPGVQS